MVDFIKFILTTPSAYWGTIGLLIVIFIGISGVISSIPTKKDDKKDE